MAWSESPAVRAEPAFRDPGPTLLRQFIARGARVATERLEEHPVTTRGGPPRHSIGFRTFAYSR
ncbi:hypothetical protein [Modestobacter sp. SYSU DS0290]